MDTLPYLQKDVKYDIHHTLLMIGVPPHLRGYCYIVDALEMIIADPDLLQHITKELYIDLALKYKATPSRVERAIRNAICITWSYGNNDLIDQLFKNCIGSNKDHPTNAVFLARLYYYITVNK